MKKSEIKTQINIELDRLAHAVTELQRIGTHVSDEPTVIETTAAGALLAQFYAGIERILKGIAQFHRVDLPTGERSHVALIKMYERTAQKSADDLPALIDRDLADELAPYRRFRHVVHHGYGFELDWSRMREGVERIESVFSVFRERILTYLEGDLLSILSGLLLLRGEGDDESAAYVRPAFRRDLPR